MNKKRLVKSKDSKIFGVAGGLAEYMNVDPVIIRALFILLVLAGGCSIMLYIILAIVMPSYDKVYSNDSAYNAPTIDGNDPEIATNDKEPQSSANAKIVPATIGLVLIFIGIALLSRMFFTEFILKIAIASVFIVTGIILLFTNLKK